MKKKELEILLSKLDPRPKSKLLWEGYPLDARSAAIMIHIATQIYNDIKGKSVIDLGCGSGILSISASLYESSSSVGIDIDKESILVARSNASKVGVEVSFIVGDISCLRGIFDTTLMNPPFGSWNRGADIYFLKKALEISNTVYSFHKRSSSVRKFLGALIDSLGGRIDRSFEIDIIIPRLFSFHKKRRFTVQADLYRVVRKQIPVIQQS